MNKRSYLWLLPLVCALGLPACSPQHNAKTTTDNSPKAPTNLAGSALSFEITGTEQPNGPDPRINTDGQFSYYFTGNQVFMDARHYNGFAWKSDYSYSAHDNQGDVVQHIKWQEGNISVDINISLHLDYLAANSGNFAMDISHGDNPMGAAHYRHTGSFRTTDQPLEMLPKGLPNSSLNLNFQTITANNKGLEIKQGSQIGMFFSGANYGKFSFNGKDYETKDVQLVPVDSFTKRIQGTLTDGSPFAITLQFERFDIGKFALNLGQGALQADGSFMMSHWIPVPDYKIAGSFTDGLKFKSKQTKIEYPYSVYLPPNYNTSGKKYPVLYLTDGQWVKEFHKIVEAHQKEFILVAIEQGPENRRMEDYKLPGATAYTRFLKEELIPAIEHRYRTNGSRSYLGVSLGGTLGEILLSQESATKPYFINYILSDGAFWANTPQIQEQLKTNLAQPKNGTISVFTASTRQGNYPFNNAFVARLQSLNNPTLVLKNIELKETHAEMGTPTFEAYIDQLH